MTLWLLGTSLLALLADEPAFRLVPGFVSHRNHSGPAGERSSITDMVGAGICVLDFDQDGDWDLFFPDRGGGTEEVGARLFRGRPELVFEDVSARAGIDDPGWSIGCAVADVDNDGDPDLFITRLGPDALLRNNGDGTFEHIQAVGPGSSWSTGAAFGDLDLDGLPDLYVCRYIDLDRVDLGARCRYFGIEVYCGPNGLPGAPDVLLRNEDGSTFRDVTREAGVFSRGTRGFSVLLVDLDGDRLPEIHVANDATRDLVFANRGGFRFEDVSLLSGAAYSGVGMTQSGMGSAAADYDGDGDEDLFVTNFQRDYNTLFRNAGNLRFQDVTKSAGIALPALGSLGWGAHFLDVGNDGVLDLFVANGHIYPELERHPEVGERYRQEAQLFTGDGRGSFRAAPLADDAPERLGRGTAVADLDANGSPDLMVNNLGEPPDLYLARPTAGAWIRLHFAGTKSSRDGTGVSARVETELGILRRTFHVSDGFLGSNEPVLHVGLGEAEQVRSLEIRWPSGIVDRCERPRLRRSHLVKEGHGCMFREGARNEP